jgi:protein SCO1/2
MLAELVYEDPFLILFGFAVCGPWGNRPGLANRPYTYAGSLIDPPAKAADFQLTDQDGQPFQLSQQQGKITLIFFGYTHCPDVCPVTLTKFKQIRSELGDRADQVKFLFISVDPERDTPEVLKAHLANYDPAIVGLTGSRSELEPVWKSYGVYQARAKDGSTENYAVDHTTRIYVLDNQGNWLLTYPYETEMQALLDDIQHLIANNQ